MNYKQRDLFENALGQMFHDLNFKPTHYVTLTFRNPPLSESSKYQYLSNISEKRAKAALKKFVIKLNIALYGRRSKKAVKMASFLEGDGIKNRHFHILMTVPDEYLDDGIDDFKSVVVDCWLKSDQMAGNPYVGGAENNDWFEDVPVDADADFVSYSLKELRYGAEPFLVELSNFSGRKIKD